MGFVAGRLLDRQVAEGVLNAVVETDAQGGLYVPTDNGGFMLPEYSEDIAAAWTVVKMMFARGWDMELQLYQDEKGSAAYRVTISRIEHQEIGSLEFADTAPLAICKAALMAMKLKI